MSASWTLVLPVPDSVSLRDASSSVLQGLTALSFMHDAYEVKQGDTVLVHSVAGGLGLIMTQVAKARGATVIGTTSSNEKAQVAKALGADHVIIYKEEEIVKRVNEITNGQGVEAVFDGVGKDTYVRSFGPR